MLEKKVFTFLIIFIITTAGIIAYKNLKIDVFPDPSPVLVQIYTHAEGMAPEEVEKFVSYPIETSLYGLPHVKKINSLSTFGLSTVSVYFEDDIDIYFARQLVSQQLLGVQEKLPEFAEAPELGPISTGLGMVYVYTVQGTPTVDDHKKETAENSILELRTLQDWVIKFQLQTVPGIAAVKSHGGDIKQFHVIVDPNKLLKYKLSLHDVMERIEAGSQNITAGYITRNKEEYLVRGIGLLEDIAGLKKILVKESAATSIFLENIAEIRVGSAIKRGEAILNRQGPVVSGIVLKLIGVNTAELIEKIDKRLAEINAGLPEGIRLVPVYNQALIIKAAFKTVSEALIIGIILVSIILFIFINDLSSALVSTLAIPFAVFTAFIAMRAANMTADLMSFGGLAIGIGLLVDATIVVVENISRNREILKDKKSDKEIIFFSINQVLRPLLYAMAMIILSFLPILTLQNTEGKLFRPFGFTLLVGIISAIVYALFFSPVLLNALGSRKLLKRKKKTGSGSKKTASGGMLFEQLKKIYLKIFDFFYKKETLTIIVFLLIFLVSIAALINTGSEFIPTLNEQTIQLQVILPQNTALQETVKILHSVHKEIGRFPEIENAYGRIGRGEAGTHAHSVNMGNTVITLKDKKHWQVANETELIEKMRSRIKQKIPGVILNFTQPIKHNLDHMVTGVRADLAIKVFGDNYDKLINLAEEIKTILGTIDGVEDLNVSKVSGLNEIVIKLDRENLARYGLDPEEVLHEVEAAVGGKTVSKIYQGDMVYDVFLRYSPEYRANIKALDNLYIYSKKGQMIPLSALAEVREESGLAEIIRENGKRYITVQCNVHGRDIGSIAAESRRKIYADSAITLPFGYYLDWGGQFELKQRAESRLYLVLFITFFLILVLLFDFLKSWKDIFVILVNLPISLSGGVLSLWLAGAYLSVPSTIGFIALLGIALENTLILITFFKRKTAEATDFDSAIRESVALRLRPVLMTKFTTIIGLFPLLFTIGIGSEIQRPLVIVVIGGIFFSIFTTLLLMPVIYKKLYSPAATN
jgi:cobalt-zinc-cadmium resistance protein CzcA